MDKQSIITSGIKELYSKHMETKKVVVYGEKSERLSLKK